MSTPDKDSNEFNDEELIRSEFDSIVSGLSLDESAPSTYLDDLDRIDREGFIAPNPPALGLKAFFISATNAVNRWMRRGHHDDDGTSV